MQFGIKFLFKYNRCLIKRIKHICDVVKQFLYSFFCVGTDRKYLKSQRFIFILDSLNIVMFFGIYEISVIIYIGRFIINYINLVGSYNNRSF